MQETLQLKSQAERVKEDLVEIRDMLMRTLHLPKDAKFLDEYNYAICELNQLPMATCISAEMALDEEYKKEARSRIAHVMLGMKHPLRTDPCDV